MESNRKAPAPIKQIELRDATFSKASSKDSTVSELTYVNFFFGNNGTGKSTIAQAIKNSKGVTFNPGHDGSDYVLHLYDEDYIDSNFHSYQGMPGLFTMDNANVEIQQAVESKQAEIRDIREKISQNADQLESNTGKLEKLTKRFRKDLWDKTKSIRERFPDTQAGFKNSQEKLVARIQSAEPKDINEEDLQLVYTSAFSEDAQTYEPFDIPKDPYVLDNMPHLELMDKSIVNSATSNFAEFMEQIGATEWVKSGHTHFSERAGDVCPYCQQKLPDNFEERFKESFDDLYEQQLKDIEEFFHSYDDEAIEITARLQQACSYHQSRYPLLDLSEYDSKYWVVEKTIETNKYNAMYKLDHPNRQYTIEPVGDRIKELCDYLEAFNTTIKANNDIVASKAQKRIECTDDVFSLMAFKVKDIIKGHEKDLREINKDISKLSAENQTHRNSITTLQSEIKALGGSKVDTSDAMENINAILRDSGMQGFHLAPHETQPNVYKVVREDGRVADKLSEGEKNFIAFLYFYYQVQGLRAPDDDKRSKIVVIDDPVSSMDSNSLFIVSTLVRNMIEVCRNNADNRDAVAEGNYIKQLFILTHNAYFHREITYNYVKRYPYVSLYLIRKLQNISSVTICVKNDPDAPTQKMNYNPVKSSYATLWDEYKQLGTATSAAPLLNVIRRILDYYFLQLCGYDGAGLRKKVLHDHKNDFINKNGQSDEVQYTLARSMLSYISASRISFDDGLHYIVEAADPDACRRAFETIFSITEQHNHFELMMGM